MDILNLIFPKRCLECKSYGKYICSDCLRRVRNGEYEHGNYSLFKYEGIIKKVIVTLKYKFAYDLKDELIELVVKQIKSRRLFNNNKGVLLVPVPLHASRKKWRGFNQTEIIGEGIAKALDWNYSNKIIQKVSKTTNQAELKRIDRLSNLNGSFVVNNKELEKHKNSTIIIFDDIITTGSTIGEIKKLLKSHLIYGLAIAS